VTPPPTHTHTHTNKTTAHAHHQCQGGCGRWGGGGVTQSSQNEKMSQSFVLTSCSSFWVQLRYFGTLAAVSKMFGQISPLCSVTNNNSTAYFPVTMHELTVIRPSTSLASLELF
jgi:hypothetical protein